MSEIGMFIRPNFRILDIKTFRFRTIGLKIVQFGPKLLITNVRFSDTFLGNFKARTSEIGTCQNPNAQKFGFGIIRILDVRILAFYCITDFTKRTKGIGHYNPRERILAPEHIAVGDWREYGHKSRIILIYFR